jgi:uncharacterized protein (TIGR02246 family)
MSSKASRNPGVQIIAAFEDRAIPLNTSAGMDQSSQASRMEGPMLSELQELSERWFQAWLKKDAATVERLMAEDYIYIAPNGLVLDRQAILGIIRSPSYRLDHGTRSEIVVRAVGQEAAVVRHRYQGAGSFEGTSFTDDQRCVMVWEKHAGEWRLVMEQCSFSSK